MSKQTDYTPETSEVFCQAFFRDTPDFSKLFDNRKVTHIHFAAPNGSGAVVERSARFCPPFWGAALAPPALRPAVLGLRILRLDQFGQRRAA